MKIFSKFSLFPLYLLLVFSIRLSASDSKPTGGFIENRGQIVNQHYQANTDVLFLYSGKGINIQLRKSGYSYELFTVENKTVQSAHACSYIRKNAEEQATIHSYRVDVDFEGMNRQPEIVKEQKSTDYLNYYKDAIATHVYSYNKITYKNIFDHVDIEFLLNADQKDLFKYNLILHAGANLADLHFLLKGAKEIKVDGTALSISTPMGNITEHIPLSYYTDAPDIHQPVRFQLENNRLSFTAQYDATRELVIDPSSNLVWATYYGDNQQDIGTSTGVDAQYNVYMAGHTWSSANIATNGSFQSVYGGNKDAFLAKFNSAGVRQWATYLGGNSFEEVYNMVVEPNGNAYITGDSDSPSGVASPGAQQTVYGGLAFYADALLAKFDSNGQRLWSTYFGGSDHDMAQGLALDNAGNVIMGGHTKSLSGIATPNAYSTAFSGPMDDVFIAKYTPAGALIWATYYGDSGGDEALGVVCDAANDIYVTGWSYSLSGLGTPGCHQSTMNGTIDGFIGKFNSTGTSLIWGTYYGGAGQDKCTAIRINKAGNLIISGNTASGTDIATPGSYQSSPGSSDDAFLTCFTPAGTRLWGTYFGGNDVDYINNMILDSHSNILVCGQTQSSVSIAAGSAPYQSTLSSANNYDAFFAKFTPSGTLTLGSYFGGPGNENAWGLALDNTGKLHITGETTSTVNIATPAAHQTTLGNSAGDAFLAKFCVTFHPVITLAGSGTLCVGNTSTISALSGYSTYAWSTTTTANPMLITHTVQGTSYYSVFITDPYGCTGQSDTLKVVVNNCYVSLDEPATLSALRLYPVPSGNFICLDHLPEGLNTIEFYTLTGQLVSVVQTSATRHEADISTLAPGLYLARVKNASGSSEIKFIKE